MEQTEARAQAQENRVEGAAEARHEAVDRAHDARGERIANANQPGEDATEDLNEIARERAQYKTEAQSRVSKLGVRLEEAAKKVNVLGDRAPAQLRSELRTAATEYNMLKADVDKLDKTQTTNWESTTSQLDKRMSTLDSRVEDLKEAIDDVDV